MKASEAVPRVAPKSVCTTGSATTTDHMPTLPSEPITTATARRSHARRESGMNVAASGEYSEEITTARGTSSAIASRFEPTFGLPATWVDAGLKEEAALKGYTVVDAATVLSTHLTELLKTNMSDLLSYGEVQKLLKDLPKEQGELIKEIGRASCRERV